MDKTNLYPNWPIYEQDEIDAAVQVLSSGKVNYWTGNECAEFEREFSEFMDCKYAISLANGTLALELALRALGIGKGDDVIVPARSYVATASCVEMVGANSIFADVNLASQNIDAKSIRQKITKRTKAIVCVHLAGVPCDMDALMEIAQSKEM